MAVGLLLLLLTASQSVVVSVSNEEALYVDAASESTKSSCGNLSSPCPTLEAAVGQLEDMPQLRSVAIHILSSNLTLSHPVILQNVTSLELTGSDSVTTWVSCSPVSGVSPPGLVFEAIDRVTIKDLHFTGCGAFRNYSTPDDSFQHNAVIHLHLCKNISINSVNTTANHGTGIAILDPAGGTVSISNSHFLGNQVPQSRLWEYAGGGGIYIRVQGEASNGNENNFLVANCTFEHNRASFPGNYSFLTVFNQADEGTGRGGGLDAIFWFNASRNTIRVVDCAFRNNTAYLGGGLAIQIQYVAYDNNVVIERCIFEENGCKEGTRSGSGGGAHFGASFYGDSPLQPHDNHYLIKDTIFERNCAELGGGMTFFSSRSSFEEATASNTYMLDNCSWIENSAHIGAAVDISPHVLGRVQEGFLPTLHFKNSKLFNNRVAFRNIDFHQSFGSGTLFSSLFNVDFLGSVHFENNSGSAFIIVNAIANFSMCNSTFVGNSGVQGAAISLIGVASLYIGPGNSYTFIGNQATDRGGAIYSYLIDDHDFAASRSCFLQYSEYDVPGPAWQSSLYFYNNTAGTYGHSIYASSITPCVLHVPREENLYDNYKWETLSVFRWPEVFVYDNRTENQIATEGGNFNLTEDPPFFIIPGEEHRLAVVIYDDIGQEVETTFRASMVSNSSEGEIEVDDAFSCLSGNVIQLLGEEGNAGVLLLETVTSRKNSIAMNITLLPCPPGFKMVEQECTCSTETYSAIVSCDLKNFHANIKVGYWVGYVDNDTFSTAVCPLGFCAYNNSNFGRDVPLPKVASSSELDEYICGPTRTGVLCGQCSEGYSVYYHSPNFVCNKSRLCKLGWLFYILSELLPVTLTFIAVLVLNISFTSGAVNGFILFSQLLDPVVIGGSGVMEYPSVISVLSYGYRLIYGFFTMEYFNIEPLSFCLWEGTTVLDVLAFRYVTFIYAFILVVSTVLFLKYCGHKFLGKCLRITTVKNSVVHGLSAFIVLCYAQCTKVSINILITVYVRGENGDTLSPKRVWFNGDIVAFSPEHLAYALPAIVCLLTIGTIPPALLLIYPSINKVLAYLKLSESRTVVAVSKRIPMNKMKPFLDSFQGCFKDDFRFFAGIYFLYRWIALLLYATVPSVTGFYTSLGAAYILILMVHTVFQPYERRAHNIADAFLLANLALIYSITGYNYLFSQGTIDTNQIHSEYITTTATIQLILIYLPIIAIALYIAIILCRKAYPKKEKPVYTDMLVISQPRPSVTSTIVGIPEEFPPRMLETEYEEYEDRHCNDPLKASTYIANPLLSDDVDIDSSN